MDSMFINTIVKILTEIYQSLWIIDFGHLHNYYQAQTSSCAPWMIHISLTVGVETSTEIFYIFMSAAESLYLPAQPIAMKIKMLFYLGAVD